MLELTVDMQTSAQVLGVAPEVFQELVEREHLEGILKVRAGWRVSIFTLARLLATTPETLLDLLEDYALGQRILEVADDQVVLAAEAREIYAAHLVETRE